MKGFWFFYSFVSGAWESALSPAKALQKGNLNLIEKRFDPLRQKRKFEHKYF